MKANELRIGNYVLTNTTETHSMTVHTIGEMKGVSVLINGYREEDVSPIPITEEWLLKFGFEWLNHGLRLGNICLRQEISGYAIYLSNESHNFKIDLKHVHQLQNLYFALTQEELTIKTK